VDHPTLPAFKSSAPTSNTSQYTNASSYHSGGVNTLFADGSVRFIRDSIAIMTWWALGTRADGETISQDSF
jgi:prepilin-type processing-associated H-X9-DG protein